MKKKNTVKKLERSPQSARIVPDVTHFAARRDLW